MPGIRLFTSNRLEVLVDKLAAMLLEKPLPVFEPEVIVVQSKGMQQWLSLELAERNRFCANVQFPFPKAFVYSLFQELEIPLADDDYSLDALTWKIMATLPALLELPEFQALTRYCAGGNSQFKSFQLAERLARLYDHYLIHRPDWINQWDRDQNPLAAIHPEAVWQCRLWRKITQSKRENGSLTHPAELKLRLMNRESLFQTIPERVSVFGISSLPPFYLEIIGKLATRVEVDIYYLNPCKLFWEYCYSAKETARLVKAGIAEENQYYEQGNPLLASMGVVGREFFSLVLTMLEDTGVEAFADPGNDSLLHLIQSDILNLVDRGPEATFTIAATDRSLQFHSCHSPLREIEVLHDNLLALFDSDAGLSPREIVVMMPDVTVYAPLIQAVFDAQDAVNSPIPYSITDVSLSLTSTLAEALLAILAIDSKRYKASAVLDILATEAVREKFEITEQDLELIKIWVEEAGIRWGIDGNYKQTLQLPAFEENTWWFGLKRLLLGIALPETDDLKLFAGISPYSDLEGEAVVTLGRFVRFMERLIDTGQRLAHAATLQDWSHSLIQVISDFFVINPTTENELQAIRETLLEKGLLGLMKSSDYKEKVVPEVIVSYLSRRLGKDLRSSGFISRGVTFCTLLPMRSIPFKAIYLLGMNDGDFPRRSQRSGFDLTDREKRLCDRSQRDEDKYLFLESLLSARNHLFISYLGQNIQDNSERPPSVLVRELLDTLQRGFATGTGDPILEQVVIRHPLQPFSPLYFGQHPRLFSYSIQNCEAAKINLHAERKIRRFLEGLLPEPVADHWSVLSLEQFCRFFQNPCEFLLKNRLGVNLRLDDQEQPEDRESFEPDQLQQYHLKEGLIDYRLQSGTDTAYFTALKAKGLLPHGALGQLVFEGLKTDSAVVFSALNGFLKEGLLPPLPVVFQSETDTFRLTGVLRSLTPAGQLFYRAAKVKARDLLSAWCHHLLWCATPHPKTVNTTFFIGTDRQVRFSGLTEAEAGEILQTLVKILHQGLCQPLPFFPESSKAFALKALEGEIEAGIKAAQKSWTSGFQPGEQENGYYKLCFDTSFPGSELFQQLALAIYTPLMRQMEEVKSKHKT